MSVDIGLLKKRLRVDVSDDDDLLDFYINAAKKDLLGSGVPEPAESNEMYDLAVMYYVQNNYDDYSPSLEQAYNKLILKMR